MFKIISLWRVCTWICCCYEMFYSLLIFFNFYYSRLACCCIAIISRMSEAQRESFILKNVSSETHRNLTVQNGRRTSPALPVVWSQECTEEVVTGLRQTVNVCGVMLPLYDRKYQVITFALHYCKLFCIFPFTDFFSK